MNSLLLQVMFSCHGHVKSLIWHRQLTLLRVGCWYCLTVWWRGIPWLRRWCTTHRRGRTIAYWRGWCVACQRGSSIPCWRGWSSIPRLRGRWWVVYNSLLRWHLNHCLLLCILLHGKSPSIHKYVENTASKNYQNYDSNHDPSHSTTRAASR